MQCVQTNGALGSTHVQGIHKSRKFKEKKTSQFGEETRSKGKVFAKVGTSNKYIYSTILLCAQVR